MQHLKMILTVFGCLVLLSRANAQSMDPGNDSVPTQVFEDHSQLDTTGITCVSYTPAGPCGDLLSVYDHPVKFVVNTSRASNISSYQETANTFLAVLDRLNLNRECFYVLRRFICHWVFATCDPAFNVPLNQHICRRGCEILSTFVCQSAWNTVIEQRSILDFGVVDPPDCAIRSYANGGEAPDCIDPSDGGEIPAFALTADCFNGRGRGYNGTVNRTRSWRTCQRWSEQAPHQFILPSSQYPEIAGGHNYCRNPGSRAPDGPWCFTTDPNTRWEYCNVSRCDSPASCQLYHNSMDAVCYNYGSIGRDYVFIDNSVDTDDLNRNMGNFLNTLRTKYQSGNFPAGCVDRIFGLMCHNIFPLCDYRSDTPGPRQVCRSYCEEVSTGECREFWNELTLLSGVQTIRLPNCSSLPSPEGGEYLECFIQYNNRRDSSNFTSDCYNVDDQGINYNGTVNTTVSGWTCQDWDSATPHSHPFTSLYRPYLEDHNYCRNPEGRGTRPWCYTTEPSVRWEYCDVPSCSLSTDTSSNNDSTDNTPAIVLGIVIPLLLIMVLTVIVLIFVIRTVLNKRKGRERWDNNTGKTPLHNNYVTDPTVAGSDRLPVISRENITYISDLGEGNFGMVMKGEAKNVIPGQYSTLVAIKVLKEGSSSSARNDFIHEAVLVHQFDHPNILKLLAVCFEKEPFCIAFEYMELGDLNKYLRNKAISVSQPASNLNVQQLVDMAINIAAGLEYLAIRHFVHRDLATRNCLINHQLFVKISDFGLSKDIYSKDYYRFGEKSVLPIRWMPPEAIVYSKFTTQSDIWSFGIVLWEIFSSGAQPYYTLSNEEVIEYVTDEKVLRCPSGCPSEIYDLMVDCWATKPDDRPTASELHKALQNWSPQLSVNNGTTHGLPPSAEGYVEMMSARNTLHGEKGTSRSAKNGSVKQQAHETTL